MLEGAGGSICGTSRASTFAIRARQIDLDRTLGGGAEEPVSVEAALAALLRAAPELPRPASARARSISTRRAS